MLIVLCVLLAKSIPHQVCTLLNVPQWMSSRRVLHWTQQPQWFRYDRSPPQAPYPATVESLQVAAAGRTLQTTPGTSMQTTNVTTVNSWPKIQVLQFDRPRRIENARPRQAQFFLTWVRWFSNSAHGFGVSDYAIYIFWKSSHSHADMQCKTMQRKRNFPVQNTPVVCHLKHKIKQYEGERQLGCMYNAPYTMSYRYYSTQHWHTKRRTM